MSLTTTVEPQVPQHEEETELCVQCVSPNRPGTNFCRSCGAPLSSYAATGPFESMLAEGNLYRRATEHPQRLIVVLGIWAIFTVSAWTGILMAVGGNGPFGIVLGGCLAAVSIFIIAKTTRNYRKRSMPQAAKP